MLAAMPSSVLTHWHALRELRRKEAEKARRKGRGKRG